MTLCKYCSEFALSGYQVCERHRLMERAHRAIEHASMFNSIGDEDAAQLSIIHALEDLRDAEEMK